MYKASDHFCLEALYIACKTARVAQEFTPAPAVRKKYDAEISRSDARQINSPTSLCCRKKLASSFSGHNFVTI
jgi:hypothetical protein